LTSLHLQVFLFYFWAAKAFNLSLLNNQVQDQVLEWWWLLSHYLTRRNPVVLQVTMKVSYPWNIHQVYIDNVLLIELLYISLFFLEPTIQWLCLLAILLGTMKK
jgi:hypothetical protein